MFVTVGNVGRGCDACRSSAKAMTGSRKCSADEMLCPGVFLFDVFINVSTLKPIKQQRSSE